MRCEDIQLDLEVYLRGQLPPDRKAEVDEHLSRCQACAREAAAMRELGRMLSQGLKEWVDQGGCPPEVMDRIERCLRAERRHSARARMWPLAVGAMAAAVFLVLLLSRQADLSQQVASLPWVGTIAAHLLYPDADVGDWEELRNQEPIASSEQNGIRITVYPVSVGVQGTRIQYVLGGSNLDTKAELSRYAAELSGPSGPVQRKHVSIRRTEDEVLVTATYDPVLPGQPLTLTIPDVPERTRAGSGKLTRASMITVMINP
jgi:hypothetical protein